MKESKKSRPYFRVKDLFIILIVLITGIGGFFLIHLQSSDQTPKNAEIRINNKIYRNISLSDIREPYEITVEGNSKVIIEVSSEGVRFKHSDCPDKLCIHSGLIVSGQSAACLPAGVSVKVTGNSENAVDAIAR